MKLRFNKIYLVFIGYQKMYGNSLKYHETVDTSLNRLVKIN